MISIVKKRLDDYLEFNSDLLFKDTDFLEIFGGSIRDAISGLEIHDIDILCMKNSAIKASEILESFGYKNVTDKLSMKNIQQMYKDTHIVFEPWTFMNNNLKIIQLIRPVSDMKFNNFNMNYHTKQFFDIMKQVDMSCCGVSYDGEGINENYPNAINHCRLKFYKINPNAKMYNKDRIFDRKYKLNSRGWTCIDDMTEIEYNKYIRSAKLNSL
ncbi:hypothetical protein M0Q50_07420 [bacterium]|jgi:hypothetical protein|nr:hypothetical protein [bacterium]